ncbi:hypothetical protein C6A50_24570 [Escherichia coli]|nr:hypothetical protein [Escherichia coli]EEY9430670.1 hypothetical protein [Escherichia coli]EEZ0191166.1 hypothetical protein [Escherichia coli]EFB2797333.1 hypothetical protein [Escherichia coli]EFB2932157.1 hypothetical protein [Escherichia coli]
MWINKIARLCDVFCIKNRGNRMHLKVDDEVVFCMWCCFFVHCRASDVRKPPARAGLFRGGQVQGEAVASRL